MFNKEEFKRNAYNLIEWIADYFEDVEKYPVRSVLNYGDIKRKLPKHPPIQSETIDQIFDDFKNIIVPGITHWQSPRYFAYFPANSSEPSVLAEFLTAALGIQGMKWVTSPAATELEEVVMDWLRQMIRLPEQYTGVIYDTASIATLCAILAAREKYTKYNSNRLGLNDYKIRVYCSSEAHSSVDKAIRIAGLGSDNLVKVGVDNENRMIPAKLEELINSDLANGFQPACIVATIGTTGTCAIDPIADIVRIAGHNNIWLHIDAAFAGTALMLPEFRSTIQGLEWADSIVFNPHKWMFTNFDCSAFFVKDKEHLQNTFRLVPSYLQTRNNNEANDFSNWGIQLGRRFRALKLWFVIRNFGIDGIQQRLREHIQLAEYFEKQITARPDFELAMPRNLAVTCFRYRPANMDEAKLDDVNALLLENINASGKAYMSHTIVRDRFILRFVCAQARTEKRHIDEALDIIFKFAREIN